MDNTTIAMIAVGAIVVLGLILWTVQRQRRSHQLRDRFGPEYEHELRERGDRRRAEAELDRRVRRVDRFTIRPLPESERSRFATLWNQQQARFVDDPRAAVGEADHLVEEVMVRRGYPVAGDFDQKAADISVDHPQVVENYRTAHHIAQRVETGDAGTEDLRRAMIHYRALFDELLHDRVA